MVIAFTKSAAVGEGSVQGQMQWKEKYRGSGKRNPFRGISRVVHVATLPHT
jgi:hypothetical protein